MTFVDEAIYSFHLSNTLRGIFLTTSSFLTTLPMIKLLKLGCLNFNS